MQPGSECPEEKTRSNDPASRSYEVVDFDSHDVGNKQLAAEPSDHGGRQRVRRIAAIERGK